MEREELVGALAWAREGERAPGSSASAVVTWVVYLVATAEVPEEAAMVACSGAAAEAASEAKKVAYRVACLATMVAYTAASLAASSEAAVHVEEQEEREDLQIRHMLPAKRPQQDYC